MKKMSKGMLMTALICGAVYLGGSPVYANELQEFSLDEYVVTAARTETKLVDTPANISVVDAQTIEERHYQDVSEVLKDVPGANVMDSGSGAYEKTIKLNGDDRVLILVDGRRMDIASGTASGGRSSFDMNLLPDVNLIERIEVLKGAGGALYGSDAVGGVVNIITKKADRSFGKVSVGFGSHDARDMSAMYSFKQGKTGLTVSAVKEKQDYFEYKDAVTNKSTKWPIKSEYENEKVSIKLEQELTASTNLTIGYDYNKYEGCTPGNISNSNDYGVSKNEFESSNFYAKYDWIINNEDAGYLQVYRNESDYYSVGISPNTYYGKVWGDRKIKTNGVDLQQAFTLSETNKLVVGTTWSDSNVDNKRMYDERIDNISFFVNDTWEFAPTWTLNAGVRYDDHSKSGDETTFSTGLNKKFNDNSHAFINWGQVFKAPTTGDLFDPYNGNTDLVAETGDTWTIGYQTQLNEKTNLSASYFESNLEDAIDYAQPDYKAKNIDEQKKKGLELNLAHQLNDNIELTASYTYIKVENNDNGQGYVRDWNYMPNTYRLGVKYKDGKWDSNVWLRAGSGGATHGWYNGYGTSYSYADSSYWTVDMAITYKANEAWSFYAKGYNLFNEIYAERAGVVGGSYEYPAQSRRFIVGAEYKF